MESIVIVGASLAGLRAAEKLREDGFEGHLEIIGDEGRLAYNRPPLSKQLLAGRMTEERCTFRQDVDARWRLGATATGLDLDRRVIHIAGTESLAFDGLIITTGVRARPWPGPLPDGVHSLRTIEDAVALRAACETPQRVVILGAGFIGCEVASTLVGSGHEITVVDAAETPMIALGSILGEACAQMHRSRGVRLLLGRMVERVAAATDGNRVFLSDGEQVSADVVVLALGATPNVEWLAGSGVECAPGVVCDDTLQVRGVPDVFAAGDVAQWPHRVLGGEMLRVEHWENAIGQARLAAANLLRPESDREPYLELPSFWSQQYDVKIQAVGFLNAVERFDFVSGGPGDRSLTALGSSDGIMRAVVTFNDPVRLNQYAPHVANQRPVSAVLAESLAGPVSA